MLTRRTLLAAVAGITLGATGCTTLPPTVWLPWPTPAPLPVPGAAEAAQRAADLAASARFLVAAGLKAGKTPEWVPGLTWLAEACELHAEVLAGGDPARRHRGTAPTGQVTFRERGALAKGLRADADRWRTSALATSGVPALIWAGLAAFSATGADLVGRRFTGAADGAATVPELTSDDWSLRMLSRSYAAVFALQSVLAAPGLTKGTRGLARRPLAAWEGVRDRLIDLRNAHGKPIPAAPAGYALSMPRSREQAVTLGADTMSTLLPQLGAWVANASSDERPIAVDALIASSRAAAGFGAPALRWPGWPG